MTRRLKSRFLLTPRFGLGAVLLQQARGNWRPVAYTSHSLTDTKKRYAQIEKEPLAVTWACKKFADYVLGLKFEVETDHKPLVPLLSTKRLDNMPPRVLRFHLRLTRFNYTISHVPGKLLYAADALSRAPSADTGDISTQTEVETFIDTVTSTSPATPQRLEAYRECQEGDGVCKQVRQHCLEGWPEKHFVKPEVMPFWKARASLTIHNNLLLFNQRIVVPPTLQKETLRKIHEGHQGFQRCQKRVKSSVWWPGITHQVTQMVQNCSVCARDATTRSEPLVPTPLPDFPWQVVASDLFQIKGDHYLLVVDYFSRYPEVIKLANTTSSPVITALKAIFSRHGIPEELRSDNGPQYRSDKFKAFSKAYGFLHKTSSPRYPQSNGQAEVQTVKRMLKKQLLEPSGDPYLALLTYQATPLPWCDLSPAELLMGRQLRTPVPQTNGQLIPKWSYLPEFQRKNLEFKGRQKRDFDRHHRARELPDLPDDTNVWVATGDDRVPGQIVTTVARPRSYIVKLPSGQIQRNRQHLTAIPEGTSFENASDANVRAMQPTLRIMTRSQTGTPISPPDKLA